MRLTARAREVPEFVATRHELLQLVKYWMREVLDTEYFCFCFETSGSREIRIVPFGYRRIARISEVIGKEAVDAAVEEVYKEFERKFRRSGEIFLRGEDAQRRALQEEIRRHDTGDGCNAQCKKQDRVENHETDWAWIDEESQRHRQGQCSMTEALADT